MTDEMRALVQPLDVRCVDGYEVRRSHPARILNGWELKPYAIIHSRFREVLLLDADNVVVVDPTYLFEDAEYKQTGSLFWSDRGRLGRDRKIWQLTGVPFIDEPEFETAQILVDKVKCWRELQLTMWFNEYSDFWYRHVHGDKETFHFAWRRMSSPYAMPGRPLHSLHHTLCHHDLSGKRVFQHRGGAKWKYIS
jgi:hypothetical protein